MPAVNPAIEVGSKLCRCGFCDATDDGSSGFGCNLLMVRIGMIAYSRRAMKRMLAKVFKFELLNVGDDLEPKGLTEEAEGKHPRIDARLKCSFQSW